MNAQRSMKRLFLTLDAISLEPIKIFPVYFTTTQKWLRTEPVEEPVDWATGGCDKHEVSCDKMNLGQGRIIFFFFWL